MTIRMHEDRILFREEQSFRQWWLWLIMLVSAVAVLGSFVAVFAAGQQGTPAGMLGLAVGVAAFTSCVALLYFARLTITVSPGKLHVRFFPFLTREYDVADIVSCAARDYRPILEYGGWGVRYGFAQGWAYNVSGHRGVQLEFASGKKLLLGSQQADELAEAVEQAREL